MKTFATYLRESLSGVKLDIEQIYKLYTAEINVKNFAVNCNVTEKDAQFIKDTLDEHNIIIVSSDELLEKYDKKEVEDLLKNSDKLVDKGVRYGAEINMSPEEKAQRDSAMKALQNESEKSEPAEKPESVENPKSSSEEGSDDDTKLIKDVCSDYVSSDSDTVQEYFWKKSGVNAYLIFVLNVTPNVEKLLKKI